MERIFATPAPVSLTIDVAAGSVSVQATRTAETTVRVEGARADDVLVEQRGSEIVVLARDADTGWGFLGGRSPIGVTVTAPVGSDLSARTASARITADGPIRNARIRSGSGAVWIAQLSGEGVIESGSGPLEIGTAAGDLRLKAGSGDVSVERAEAGLVAGLGSGSIDVAAVAGRAGLRSGSGDVRVLEADADIDATTASGDVAIERVRRGTVKATTASGDVRIGVVAGVPVWTDVRTVSGKIRSDLRGAGQPGAGQDYIEIHATTVSGDVTLTELVPAAAAPDAGASDAGASDAAASDAGASDDSTIQ